MSPPALSMAALPMAALPMAALPVTALPIKCGKMDAIACLSYLSHQHEITRRKHVSVLNAVARIHGEAMSAPVAVIFCKRVAEARSTWTVVWVIILGLSVAAAGAYTVYKCSLHVKASML
ncbi:hypothetical protein Tco_0606113, partial [Tanacetum coccineum]